MIGRLTAISLGLVGLAVACGIPGNGDVSRIQDGQLGALIDTLPTTSTSTTTTLVTVESTTTTVALSTSTTIAATEDATLYFINGGILVEFQTPVPKGAAAGQILAFLQKGPPKDLGAGLRTALPTQPLLSVQAEDGTGIATVDLPANFYDTIKQEDQRFAIGQIVLTLTEVGRIGQVKFTQGGIPVPVPRGAGDFSQPGEPLPASAYFELLQSPISTTTTTTVPSSSPAAP